MAAARILVPPVLEPRALQPPRDGELATVKGTSMGTTWTVQAIVGNPGVDVRAVVERALADVIAQMSTWEPDSHLSRFNRAAADTWHTLPHECFEVLSYALSLARATDGAYDPTIGALVDAWGFGASGARTSPPSTQAIEAARARCGWQRIRLSLLERRAHQPGGVAIDVASIGKGFAVDHVARALETHGLMHHLVEIGGELRGAGCKPDGSPWWVEIERVGPDAPRILVALHQLSIATSGDYRRYLEHDGRRYSHTLDPRTGWPVDNDLVSVTVLARECMHADALATALYVLGLEQGLAFARARGIAALFQQRTAGALATHWSPAVEAYLT
jgi:thiamine biosynthesis lipoprotein